MAPVFINIVQNGSTHMNTKGSMAILCAVFVFTGKLFCCYLFPLDRCPLFSMPFSPYDTNYPCFMIRPYVNIIHACPIILKISSMEECQVYFEPNVALIFPAMCSLSYLYKTHILILMFILFSRLTQAEIGLQ